ncbi:hypothetical protein EKD04_024750 [Chloroflexales bacterium ZM16-3]|nr:hypothetical protein [Chloroflexales bacterium ZM16-3]
MLPTSPAYARVLLRAGKARRVAHPTLSIIQLTQPVDHPTTPPVVLAAQLHGAHAELLLVMERAGLPVILHRLLLDLSLSATLCPDPADIPAIFSGVRRGLGRLLPITHLVLQRATGHTAVPTVATGAGDAAPVIAALPALQAQAARRTALVAVWVATAQAAAGSRVRAVGARNYVVPEPVATVGAVVQIAHGARTATGLITACAGESWTVQTPVAVRDDGICWQTQVVPTAALTRIWQPTEVALLPLAEVQDG